MANVTDNTSSDERAWTVDEERRLVRCCTASMTVTQLAIRLDRTETAIIAKLRELHVSAGRFRDGAAARRSERRRSIKDDVRR